MNARQGQLPPGMDLKPATKPWAKLPADHPVATCSYVGPVPEPTVPSLPEHPVPGQTYGTVSPPVALPQYIVDAHGRWSVVPESHSGRC